MDLLQALQDWFAQHCDGDWEQECGLTIETLDNPGWLVTISLIDTELESRPFPTIQRDRRFRRRERGYWLVALLHDRRCVARSG